MTVRDEVTRLTRGWVSRADEDLLVAEHLLRMRRNCPFGIAAFHCQQAAEKYIKALLTWRSVQFPRSHDLPELLTLVPRDAGLKVTKDELSILNRYSVEVRYPGDWEPVTRAEARDALETAMRVKGAVMAILSEVV
jgi:HEPN domain-containing protein